mgnify:CR=1 FL=1
MTTMIGGKDRSYYRLEGNRELLGEAKYYPSTELCIVLAERLHNALETILELESKNERKR